MSWTGVETLLCYLWRWKKRVFLSANENRRITVVIRTKCSGKHSNSRQTELSVPSIGPKQKSLTINAVSKNKMQEPVKQVQNLIEIRCFVGKHENEARLVGIQNAKGDSIYLLALFKWRHSPIRHQSRGRRNNATKREAATSSMTQKSNIDWKYTPKPGQQIEGSFWILNKTCRITFKWFLMYSVPYESIHSWNSYLEQCWVILGTPNQIFDKKTDI